MRLLLKLLLGAALSAPAVVGATAASGQDDAALLRDAAFARDRNVSVTERPKPEYEAVPVRVGAFIVDPVIAAGLEYNDNIYATNTDQQSDGILHVQPSVLVTSDWSRNQVSAFARASSSFYFDHTGEDTTDGAIGASGRLDVQRDLGFAGGASFERDTQPRTSEASPEAAAHPVRYDVADTWIEGTKDFNRLRVTARGSIDDYSYDNAQTTTGLQIYEQDQDHTSYVGALQAEYAYLPETSLLASLVANHREYRDELPGETSRTSSGYELTVGTNFDLSHLARGELYIGYLEQDYDNINVFRNVSGIAARGKVEYFPTQLTTITVSGSRSVEDSGIINVGGFLASTVTVQVDHELLRNLILSAGLSYTEDDYSNYNRSDKINSEQASAKYLMNRAVSLNLTYAHLNQDSSGTQAGPKYDINRVIGSLAYRF
jgi:hypothetical protein